jgi:hypothetical protein
LIFAHTLSQDESGFERSQSASWPGKAKRLCVIFGTFIGCDWLFQLILLSEFFNLLQKVRDSVHGLIKGGLKIGSIDDGRVKAVRCFDIQSNLESCQFSITEVGYEDLRNFPKDGSGGIEVIIQCTTIHTRLQILET